MDTLELVRLNLLSPMVLAFALGILATLARSDLRFPEGLSAALTIYLLLAIGLKGGGEIAVTPLRQLWAPALATLSLGVVVPIWCYVILRYLGGFSAADAAALAAHYGSVSAVTFIASLTFLQSLRVPYEGFMPALVALLEFPAILVGLLIAQAALGGGRPWGEVLREVFVGKTVLLLLGGLMIGYLSGKDGLEQVSPLFVDLFMGALVLFLLDMGMVAGRRLHDLARAGAFLIGFGVVMPIFHGALGVYLGALTGLSLGGSTVLGVLAASASYIAAPAAVRVALPQANPTFYLTASLVVTFPFNLVLGIPLYYAMARLIHGGG